MDVKEWVLSQRENMLDTAMELMKIRSVSEPGTRRASTGRLRHGIGQSVGDREANGL